MGAGNIEDYRRLISYFCLVMQNRFLPNEQGSTWTHLAGVVFALSSIWMVWPAIHKGWEVAFGVIFFIAGMFLMFLCSTLYHWVRPGAVKRLLRKCDHISIYVMIACSYTPICIGVIGGWLGWLVFGLQWAAVIGGTFYKIFAMNKYPRLSLAIYLTMGWSVLLIMPEVWNRLTALPLALLLAEGIFYTSGTYFYSHDDKRFFHPIWHVFVFLGALAHWGVVLSLIIN